MEQLSVPAVLLARQVYFPDMPLVRLLSLRVPSLSSARCHHMSTLSASLKNAIVPKHHRGVVFMSRYLKYVSFYIKYHTGEVVLHS